MTLNLFPPSRTSTESSFGTMTKLSFFIPEDEEKGERTIRPFTVCLFFFSWPGCQNWFDKKKGGGLSFFPAKQAKREQQRKPKREVCTSSFFSSFQSGKNWRAKWCKNKKRNRLKRPQGDGRLLCYFLSFFFSSRKIERERDLLLCVCARI